MSKVLITGGAGFIGAHTAHNLLQRGFEVRLLDLLKPPVHPTSQPPAWLPPEAELFVGDIRDPEAVGRALEDIDDIIHLAAYQDYLPDFSTFFHTNTVGTALLYELIVERRLDIRKVVVASSQASYGEGRYLCPSDGVVFPDIRPKAQLDVGEWHIPCPHCGDAAQWETTDESHTNPQHQYGLSKYTQELVAFSLGKRYGIPTTCMRYSITQGRWQSPFNAYSGICRIFTLRAQAGKRPIVFEDGNQLRDYVYVEDVARANLLALEDPRTDFEAYNVGGDKPISALEYARIVTDIVRPGLEPEVPGYYRFGDPRHIVSDSSKLRALGWCNTKSVPEVVAEYAAWIQEARFKDTSSDAGIQRMLELGTIRQARAAAKFSRD
jgi:dTDP-L-rhamnose 4-epimerase